MEEDRSLPLVDLGANYRRIREEVDASLQEVLDTTSFVLGPKVASFERSFAAFTGASHCVGVANGTDALRLALEALGVSSGDEVITQANTFVATALAISALGARVVLVDVEEDTMMMDPSLLEAALTEKTRAIVPVALYGMCPDLDAILDLANKHQVAVVLDAAQAHGTLFKGQGLGEVVDVASYSFYPGKNLGAFGDAGAVVTQREDLAESLQFRRNWGSKIKYHHEVKGFNSRLDTMQAGVLEVKLKYLAEWNEERCTAAAWYHELLAPLATAGKLVLPTVPADCSPVWHLYVIRVVGESLEELQQRRDQLLAHLHSRKVFAGIHYPIPIHELGAYEELKEAYQDKLPQVERVVSVLEEFFEES